MVKGTKVFDGVYHYFGRIKNSRVEERLQVSWMRKNYMTDSWRANNLRGDDGEKLNKCWRFIRIRNQNIDLYTQVVFSFWKEHYSKFDSVE